MIETIKKICSKYRELIIYVIVGVITTVVNWAVSFILDSILDSSIALQNIIINIIAWIAAVVVSFPLNRKWVFRSTNPNWFNEFLGFTGARVSTLLIEEGIMLLFVNILGIDFKIAKLIDSIVVMILNYIFSKLLVFRKGQSGNSFLK